MSALKPSFSLGKAHSDPMRTLWSGLEWGSMAQGTGCGGKPRTPEAHHPLVRKAAPMLTVVRMF